MDLFSNKALEGGARQAGARLGALDVARGLAVLAMVVYHAAWDLSELRLIETEVTLDPGWRFFARAIAASFLFLSGIGLALAHRNGIRWRSFVRRLATVGGAALAVTAATFVAFPQSYIFFGILHAIAVSAVLALPFTQAPAWASLLGAAAIWGAAALPPHLLFDAPALAFLGLVARVPNTNDWVPLVPWAGFVLAGVAAARMGRPLLARLRAAPPTPTLGRALAWAGRHSLVIYLLHQPVLFGALAGVAQVAGPNPAAIATPFLRSCSRSCAETGASEAVCRATCACTVDELKRSPVWSSVLSGRVSPDQHLAVGETARACFERSRP